MVEHKSLSTFPHQGHHKMVTPSVHHYWELFTKQHEKKCQGWSLQVETQHKNTKSRPGAGLCDKPTPRTRAGPPLTIVRVISSPALHRPEIGSLQEKEPLVSAQRPWTRELIPSTSEGILISHRVETNFSNIPLLLCFLYIHYSVPPHRSISNQQLHLLL